ncbi:MAG: hypothetical protein R3B13_03575 [Polyangiaceae bacterium]
MAYTCVAPPAFEVYPPPLVRAPLNTHVWVRATELALRRARGCDAASPCPPTVLSFELRSAPVRDKESHVIECRLERAILPETEVYELIPRERLRPRARYDVVVVSEAAEILVGTLRTGTKADEVAPSWTASSAYRPSKPQPSKPGKPRVITLDDYEGAAPIFVQAAPAKDEGGPGLVRYQVWSEKPGATLDFSQPAAGYGLLVDPRTFAESPPLLGIGFMGCRGFSFDSRDEGPVRIGVIAVDLAGNRSAPAVFDLPARK